MIVGNHKIYIYLALFLHMYINIFYLNNQFMLTARIDQINVCSVCNLVL